MPTRSAIALAVLFLARPAWVAQNDPCSAARSPADVRFTLAQKDGRSVFEDGEIIPLVLSFTSTTAHRYWADVRNYDRSGRLGIEYYCVEPEAPDPLASYFNSGGFLGGGLGTTRELDAAPFTAKAELNEWRSLAPGHYRVYAISYRVWRPPDPNEQTPYGRVSETVRSNTVDLQVNPPDPSWQAEQLRSAVQTLAGAPSAEPGDAARRAARRLRFLNTQDSTRQLARLFWGLNQQQPTGWDLMFGLYGSPYRKLAIDSMHDQIAAPDHPITSEFLSTLVNLQVSADPAWDFPSADEADPEAAAKFWERRRAHTQALLKAELEKAMAALPRKAGGARALTLNGLLMAGGWDQTIAQTLRPALIAAWADLPLDAQRELIQSRWPLIAGPEMLPILRRMVAEPPPSSRTYAAMVRDAALKHIQELDPAVGRALILRDALDSKAQPDVEVIELLPKQDIAAVVGPAVERIARHEARELDYELLDRYADGSALGAVQPVFEAHLGKWACAPQSAMLRYFLRVDPAYGAKQVSASLSARKDTHCYSGLLQSLGDQLPKAQQSAIAALDDSDPELAQNAVVALGHWGSADTEEALWTRLRRLHQEWAGREGQLRTTPDYKSPGSRGAALEQALVTAIAAGNGWICPPDKLARLAGLALTKGQTQQIDTWIQQWKQGPALIDATWFPEDRRTFSALQYSSLTEEQLRAKLAQFPRGMQLMWQFWPPGQISPPVSMAVQEAVYERVRSVAENNGLTLGRATHP
jgi:hypothetical protein